MTKDEAARIKRRIATAERRLARGIDIRREKAGTVSERALLERLKRLQGVK